MKRPRSLFVRDALLAVPAALVAVMAAATNAGPVRPDSPVVQVGFALYALGLLTFRRSRPLACWSVSVVVAVVMPPLVLRTEPAQVVLAFALYTLLANSDRLDPVPAAVLSYAGALAGSVAMDLQLDGGVGLDTVLMPALSVVYGAGLGAVVRVNRRTAADLAERNAELVALNEVARREAVLAERARIAREVHDIVAHNVSGIVLHARAARDAADKNPESAVARDALDTIASIGAEALTSMRGLLSMLRDGDVDNAPQPGIDALPDLVASMQARGLPTALEIHGTPAPVPVDIQLSAYRIVQEALTNASRHARAQRCTVVVSWEAHGLRVTVDDNGVGPTVGYREGHGLVGMRERAALVGGSVVVAASPSGGWRVEAVLPWAPAEVSAG